MTTSPYPYRNKLAIILLYAAAYGVLYVIPNFFSQAPAALLPFLPIDTATPFLPWTFIIYTSDYLVFALGIFWITDREEYLSFSRMMFLTLFVCGCVFYLFPTTYPRPEYPPQDNAFIGFLMNLVASADSPRNCFPSMHVALTGGATYAMRHKGRLATVLLSIWSVAIFASTLTTKQHYFYDILGGICVTGIAIYFERAVYPRLAGAGLIPAAFR